MKELIDPGMPIIRTSTWNAAKQAEDERLCAAATPGPWHSTGLDVLAPAGGRLSHCAYHDDASFIAHVRTAYPDLLVAYAAQQEEIVRLVKLVEDSSVVRLHRESLAAEREACAQELRTLDDPGPDCPAGYREGWRAALQNADEAIRARGTR